MDFNITFVPNIFQALWSQSGYVDAGTITSSFVSNVLPAAPIFSITQYDVNPEVWSIPRKAIYTYNKMVIQSQGVGDLAPGATTTVLYNSFQIGNELVYLSVCPRK